MNLANGSTIGIVYPREIHRRAAMHGVRHVDGEKLGVVHVTRDCLEFANGCRVYFIQEDRQERDCRGLVFDELRSFAGAYISEEAKYRLKRKEETVQ